VVRNVVDEIASGKQGRNQLISKQSELVVVLFFRSGGNDVVPNN